MADPPPPSPSPTIFNTPEQSVRSRDETPPPVSQVAGTSLTLAFQTPSTRRHPSTINLDSASAASTRRTYDDGISAISTTGIEAPESVIEDSTSNGLPRYLLSLAGRNDVGLNLASVLEEEAERGDGGDSDVEGDDAREHDGAMNDSLLDIDVNSSIEENNAVVDGEEDCVLLSNEDAPAPIVMNIPDTPPEWLPPTQKTEQGEPTFAEVDNPGNWSQYIFRPEFGTTAPKQYKRHSLPTGAQPVPANSEGKRIVEDWEFHYKGWEAEADEEGNSDSFGRAGATGDDMFPDSRKGQLDAVLLEKLGLTKERMQKGDALFFHQLLLPMCDPKMSGINGDARKAFYSQVETFSNLYAIQIGLGGSYGHKFKNVTLDELVRFDGVVVRDGVKGGSNGAIYRRWMNGADYDSLTQGSITHTRWLQIKRVMKLNNNQTSPKRGEEGYNPAFKFDLIYDVLISNLNAVTKYAEADQCGDETTWGHGGYGEAGSGLAGRIMGKPGITRGGQIVVISDVSRCRPRAFVHRHKLHERPRGFVEGPNEVRMIVEQIMPLIEGQEADSRRQIWKVMPHMTWDNYFSGCIILNLLGELGLGATVTCRRDRLPKEITDTYLHKKKTDSSPRPKAARYFNPIVAVKNVAAVDGKKGYQRVHTSFQSTSSCNISTVNALSSCNMSIRRRERGRGLNKRYWGIEMNHARSLYLQSYYRIDCIDHLIQNARIFYRSWKYWHSPVLHGKGLAVVVAFDMYLECCEGKLNSEWKIGKPLNFWQFREKLSEQMLDYDPLNRLYPGDQNMRVSTRQPTKNRRDGSETSRSIPVRRGRGRPNHTRTIPVVAPIGRVTKEQFQLQSKRRASSTPGNPAHSRLCGDLSHLQHHINSVVTAIKRPKVCQVCGENAYSKCGLCNVALHYFPKKGANVGAECFLHYHSDSFFGLAECDAPIVKKMKKDWEFPTNAAMRGNATYIRGLVKQPTDQVADNNRDGFV